MGEAEDDEPVITCYGVRLRLKPKLTQARLRELLDYDPDSGVFRWRVRRTNTKMKVGDVAGCVHYQHGRRQIEVDGIIYHEHRLVYLWMYGRFPKSEIDHISRVATDNRLSNLIETDRSTNAFNIGLRSTNTSGHSGVCWHANRGKWLAYIGSNGAGRHLGYFRTIEEAAAARRQAE